MSILIIDHNRAILFAAVVSGHDSIVSLLLVQLNSRRILEIDKADWERKKDTKDPTGAE